MADDFEEMTRDEVLATIPDNGTWLRRLRRWNVKHHYVASLAIWATIVWALAWVVSG
jgi:hypothetical protein